MHGPLLGEFMGTMVLILFGDGVVANVLLKKSKGEGSGWIVIATGWGLGVTAGIFTAIACGSPGAHINPAVTLAVALTSHNWTNVVPFWIAQILGGFAGAVLVWLAYLPHWKETPDEAAKLGIFCTAPAIRRLPANAMTEIIATCHSGWSGICIHCFLGCSEWTSARICSVSLGTIGLGAWFVARRSDRICDEPCARFWSTPGALHFADCRKGQVGLGLCSYSNHCSIDRRRHRCGQLRDISILIESSTTNRCRHSELASEVPQPQFQAILAEGSGRIQ